MNTDYSFKIYTSTAQLPLNWDDVAISTIFLSKKYLEVLENSSPENMICHFIGIFENETLVGISLSQFLNLNKLASFGERDQCIKTAVRNIVFRNFGSQVLVLGNNMLTGQNCYALSDSIDKKKAMKALYFATTELKKYLNLKVLLFILRPIKILVRKKSKTLPFQNSKMIINFRHNPT